VLIDNAQTKYGINPMISPSKKDLLNKKFFFINKNGINENKGTNTKKVFIINDKPIQIPKRRI